MNAKEYRKARPGLVVVTRTSLSNGWGTIPAGTKMTVTHKRSGFTLKSEPCSCCGATLLMSKVPAWDVDVAPPPMCRKCGLGPAVSDGRCAGCGGAS